MTQTQSEKLLSLKQAARHKLAKDPITGRAKHSGTIGRWALEGIKGPGGRRVRLDFVRYPSGLFTTASAIEKFFKELNAPPDSSPEAPDSPRSPNRPPTPDQADRELAKMGM